MQVQFGMTSGGLKGIATVNIDKKEFKFNKGLFSTTEKSAIEALLSSPLYRRGEIQMVTDPKLVNDYLTDDKKFSIFGSAVLDSVTNEGILKLAEACGIRHNNLPGIAKASLRGLPITDECQNIIEKHQKPVKDEGEVTLEKALADGVVTYNRPWYKSADGSFSTKSKEEIIKWVLNNV